MRAMVMAAGKGTRLAPLTDVLPKPAIPVANEPVMGHLLRLLARQGFREVIANISYMADRMEEIFGDGSAYGVDLTWSREEELLGTAGGVKNAEWFLRQGDEPVLVLSGDGLHDADLLGLIRQHQQKRAMVTIGLSRVTDASEYGVAILDEEGFITRFQEKPAPGEELSNLANTGIYVFDPAVLDMLPEGEFYDFGTQLFPRMMEEGTPMLGVALDGYWNDIGALEAFRDSNLAAVDGRIRALDLPEGDGRFPDDVLVHPTASIAADAEIIGPCVIGSDVTVGAGARVARSVLLPGAEVPEGALLAAATFGSAEGLARWAESLSHTHVPAP